VVDSDIEDLGQEEQVHVDRACRERPLGPAVASASAIDDLDHPGLLRLGRGGDLGGLSYLALAVAVDLGDRDLREAVVLEERKQVICQVIAGARRGSPGGARRALGELGRRSYIRANSPSRLIRLADALDARTRLRTALESVLHHHAGPRRAAPYRPSC
jgi:hypothetical protein